jgi:hypothetical protein
VQTVREEICMDVVNKKAVPIDVGQKRRRERGMWKER